MIPISTWQSPQTLVAPGLSRMPLNSGGALAPSPSASEFQVRMLRPSDLGPSLIASWNALEARACHPNAFLSSNFILPALEHLTPTADVRILVIDETGGSLSPELRGVGIFQMQRATTAVPWPHLSNYNSIHSFLGGLLIDREHTLETLRALFCFLSQPGAEWRAVHFSNMPADGPWEDLCHAEAALNGLQWCQTSRLQRSVLRPHGMDETYLRTHLSSRSKDCARLRKHLAKLGEVTWEFKRGEQVSDGHIERFLNLEHTGWKAEGGTSLLSRENETRFFRQMIRSFRQRGETFFTELKVDGNAIASTSNLISGSNGFAFKLGWNAAFSRFSPGILNEFEFLRQAPRECSDLGSIDGGSPAGSFIDNMWLDRRTLISGVYTASPSCAKAVVAMNKLRQFIGKR